MTETEEKVYTLDLTHPILLGVFAVAWRNSMTPPPGGEYLGWGYGMKRSIQVGDDLWSFELTGKGMVVERKVNFNVPSLGRRNEQTVIPMSALNNIRLEFRE